MGTLNAADLRARARVEAQMIASALQDAPPLDRERMGAELFPFNEVASASAVQDAVAKIVRKRLPDSAWPDAHRALIHTDNNGKGYAEFMDTYRDVAFLIGVDFALRSLPSWLSVLRSLPEEQRRGLELLTGATALVMAEDKGGAR